MAEEIIEQPLSEALRYHFLNYAMSVITDRALPDVRDGLKPVHRRILYTMYENSLAPDKAYRKCADTVGSVLGRYHPHGDTSVYGAMVILAQDFSTRYMLVDGHGNFGSVDGHPAAAYRYTESRLTNVSATMLSDLNKETVDFKSNYDDRLKEPVVLPTLIPNLLANGTAGIAVGMATSVPPHNLRDLYSAINYIIDCAIEGTEPDIDSIIDIIKAPDFPTGGIIMKTSGIRDGYLTGKGKVVIRSKYEIETLKDRNFIIVTEIPYKVNKADLVEKIDDLRRNEVIPGIKEVNDESNKKGMRIVIELKKDANPQFIINKLFKHTYLQDSFSINMNVLVNGQPKVLNIKETFEYFMAHAAEVIVKRNVFDLDKAQKRLNIVDCIISLLSNDDLFDQVINILRKSETPVDNLLELEFNTAQVDYILDLNFRSITKASLNKLITEKAKLEDNIVKYNEVINDQMVLLQTMKTEFMALSDRFGDERKSQISLSDDEISESDLVQDEVLVVTVSSDNLIKTVEESEYKTQNRGGKGVKSVSNKNEDVIKHFLTVNSKDNLLFFTNFGRCHILKAYKIDKAASRVARGKSIANYISLLENEQVVSVLSADSNDKTNDLLFVTLKGTIKRLPLDKLSTRMSVTKVVTFKENDLLQSALVVKNTDEVLITTSFGKSIRLSMNLETGGVRPMGRSAAGVNGIKLTKEDFVVDMCIISDISTVFTITEKGLGKRTKANSWSVQSRNGKGVITHKVGDKTGRVVSSTTVTDADELFIITQKGLVVRINVKDISVVGRNSTGVKIMSLNEGDKITSISKGIADEQDLSIVAAV